MSYQHWTRFRTTLDFDREYLWNGSSNRQAENGVINYDFFHVWWKQFGNLRSTNEKMTLTLDREIQQGSCGCVQNLIMLSAAVHELSCVVEKIPTKTIPREQSLRLCSSIIIRPSHPLIEQLTAADYYCLSPALCLQWYNGLITWRVHSTVTKQTTVKAQTTDRQPAWNKCRWDHSLESVGSFSTHLYHCTPGCGPTDTYSTLADGRSSEPCEFK